MTIIRRGGKHEGIIFDLKGNYEVKFVWGLGKVANNQVEALTFFQGLQIVGYRRINNFLLIGD